MGVVYKIKSEIKAFVLEKKKENPSLSCRKVTQLVEEQFKNKISKSSINAIFKESGLSMPVGRRLKKRRRPSLKLQIALPTLEPTEKLIQLSPSETKIELPAPARPELPVELAKPQPIVSEDVTEKSTPVQLPESKPPIELTQVQPFVPEDVREVSTPEPPIELIKPEHLVPEAVKETPVEPIKPEPVLEPTAKIAAEIVSETQTTGAILLKAADLLIGGVSRINEIIRSRVRVFTPDLFVKTEILLYSLFFNLPDEVKFNSKSPLWPLISKKVTTEDILSYLNELQQLTALLSDISRTIPALFFDVRGIKVLLADNSDLYLDGQLHTIWSTQHIPNGFSTTLSNLKSYIKRCFQDDKPFVFSMAPGYDVPTSEFFDFILSLNSPGARSISSFSIYGCQFEELDLIKPEQMKKCHFIFGLWPWQFIQYRKVNKIKEFHPFYFEPLKTEFFVAEIELELTQPDVDKEVVILRGYALKTNLSEKTRLVILSNFPAEMITLERICNTYLGYWPNLEEGFQDYSRKIELFTYTVTTQPQFVADSLALLKEPAADINSFFNNYLKALDLFVKSNFLPFGYENNDFSTTKEQFYNLPVLLKQENGYYSVLFKPPAGYALLNDLKYACCRLNEREITSGDGKKYWFSC